MKGERGKDRETDGGQQRVTRDLGEHRAPPELRHARAIALMNL
jgi:hypothetical protein